MFSLDGVWRGLSRVFDFFTEGPSSLCGKIDDDHSTVSSEIRTNLLNSSNFDHIPKKQKLSPVRNRIPEHLRSSNFAVSRGPHSKPHLKREVHAPCRPKRFGFSANSKKSILTDNEMGCKRGILNSLFNPMSELEYRNVNKREINGSLAKRKDSLVIIDSDDEWVKVKDKGKAPMVIDLDNEWVKVENTVNEGSDSVMETLGMNFNRSLSSETDNISDMMDTLSLSKPEPQISDVSLYNDLNQSLEKFHESLQKSDVKLQNISFQINLTLKERERQKKLQLQKKREDVKKGEAFTPLTKEEKTEINRVLSNPTYEVLVSHEKSGIDITGNLLKCLRPGQWLNDEVINVYLELLKERENREPEKFLKCHFFNTFFYKKLISGENGYNFQSVKRWTSQRKLGYSLHDCDKIFVPIHQEAHWCLAIINNKDQKIQYLDSLGGIDEQVTQSLSRYYGDEVRDKSGIQVDISSWKIEFVKDLPRQKNTFDCGVFMIKYVDFYSRKGLGLCFNQENMPYFRGRTVKEILRMKAD